MKTRRKSKNARDGMSIAAELMLAPMVMWMRLPVMAMEKRSAFGMGTETQRAINEKSSAVAEGAIAAQMSLIDSATRFWPDLMSGRMPATMNGVAAERALNAALDAVGRTVKDNHRRLSTPRG